MFLIINFTVAILAQDLEILFYRNNQNMSELKEYPSVSLKVHHPHCGTPGCRRKKCKDKIWEDPNHNNPFYEPFVEIPVIQDSREHHQSYECCRCSCKLSDIILFHLDGRTTCRECYIALLDIAKVSETYVNKEKTYEYVLRFLKEYDPHSSISQKW